MQGSSPTHSRAASVLSTACSALSSTFSFKHKSSQNSHRSQGTAESARESCRSHRAGRSPSIAIVPTCSHSRIHPSCSSPHLKRKASGHVQCATFRNLNKIAVKAKQTTGGGTLKDFATRTAMEGFARTRKMGSLDKLVRQKQRYAKLLIYLTLPTLAFTIVVIELRLRDRYSSASVAIEVLRSLTMLLTAVSLCLMARHSWIERTILLRVDKEVGHMPPLWAFQVLLMVVGIFPPGVEGAFMNPPLPDYSQLPLDCLGVLIFLRLILIIKWALSLTVVADVAVLSYRHDIDVGGAFPLRYVFQTRPVSSVTTIILGVWFCCSYVLHVLEYDAIEFESEYVHRQTQLGHFFLYCMYAWDVLSATGAGRVAIYTIGGHVVTIILSVSCVLTVAMVTAIFVSAAELDPAQTYLLHALQKRAFTTQQRKVAANLIFFVVKQFLLRRKARRAAQVSGSDHPALCASSFAPSFVSRRISCFDRPVSSFVTSSVKREMARNVVRVRVAMRKFKSQRLIIEKYSDTQVANLKVLQSSLASLASEQAAFRETTQQSLKMMQEMIFEHVRPTDLHVLESECIRSRHDRGDKEEKPNTSGSSRSLQLTRSQSSKKVVSHTSSEEVEHGRETCFQRRRSTLTSFNHEMLSQPVPEDLPSPSNQGKSEEQPQLGETFLPRRKIKAWRSEKALPSELTMESFITDQWGEEQPR